MLSLRSVLPSVISGLLLVHCARARQLMPCGSLSQCVDFDALSKSAGARTSRPIRPGNEAG